ncbi:hypothetical protein U9M48_024258, partial [Paspalum notatum var. saurae]
AIRERVGFWPIGKIPSTSAFFPDEKKTAAPDVLLCSPSVALTGTPPPSCHRLLPLLHRRWFQNSAAVDAAPASPTPPPTMFPETSICRFPQY